MILKDAVDKYRVVTHSAARMRIHRGWDPVKAVLTPYVFPNKGFRSGYGKKFQALDCSGARYGDRGSYTLEQWRAKCAEYAQACAYCRVMVTKLTKDHVTPLARGGRNTIDNIVPACRKCNAKKGVLTADEFRARLATLSAPTP